MSFREDNLRFEKKKSIDVRSMRCCLVWSGHGAVAVTLARPRADPAPPFLADIKVVHTLTYPYSIVFLNWLRYIRLKAPGPLIHRICH